MSRTIKVGKIPGKLEQIVLEDNISYTAREVFDIAGIDIDENYTINDGSSKIGLNDIVNGTILVASAKIKGNAGRTIKVGKIPGKLEQIVLEDNYTAREVFDIAGIDIDENYTINDGSSKIGLNDIVNGTILVASAKIKGNAGRTIKVGKIPGKLEQIVLEDNISYTAREVFDIAGIDIDENYTINDGSSKIGLDDIVQGTILVASAKIKGNSNIYSVKQNVGSDYYKEIPIEMIYGKFIILNHMEDNVILEDIDSNEMFLLEKNIFEEKFEIVNSNIETKEASLNQVSCNELKIQRKNIEYKIRSLQYEIGELELKIKNNYEQINYLESFLDLL